MTLASRNFIRLVSIKVMLKCAVFMENWIPVSSTGMKKKEALERQKRVLGGQKRGTGRTGKGLLGDTIIK
ncbi:hypothetical protein GO685_01430 [Wolbachia endosymbiont of Madathamugadia hiepei]|uniref:hypothetical protein n=1 Tax=Wolbachia endosymbiont of Madathamugadia hiepei TaxID=1241303 RepID=UPI0015891F0A|nr:hypothetical protein [Wolbachia endosymbiont of Madathamugadia hiepei]NUX01186.1 hypothetical protein [Wolbachia endosymbiont of Madathamugadia hiepei]